MEIYVRFINYTTRILRVKFKYIRFGGFVHNRLINF